MKVLLVKWNGYAFSDIEEAFKNLGYDIAPVNFDINGDYYSSEKFETELFDAITSQKPDFLFTFNYYPVISKVCERAGIKAAFWVYDSPHYMLFSPTAEYPGNHIFCFDKALCEKLISLGKTTISYLPLASNAKRLGAYDDLEYFKTTQWANKTDISFVGSMYTADKNRSYPAIAPHLSRRLYGFLEGLMAAQHKVYGYNFIEELLTEDILNELEETVNMDYVSDGSESREYLYAQCLINRELTARERLEYLLAIGAHHPYDLYTTDRSFTSENCINHGPIDFYHGAPHVFKYSRINLNFTLRSILSGIPLRAFEVLGSGGFLLSNYQADFDDCYTAFEDYVFFDSREDLLNKIDYYLSHEKERAEIAENGYQKTLSEHSFEKRISESIIPSLFS